MNRKFNATLFSLPALSLVVAKSTSILSLIFCVSGLYYFFSAKRPRAFELKGVSAEIPLLSSLLLFASLLFFLNIYHEERWGSYHLPIAIALSIPAFMFFCLADLKLAAIWLGSATGSIAALSVAMYEIIFLGADRAGYWVHNPIPFGSIAMCLSAFAIIGYQTKSELKSVRNAFQIFGCFAGFIAAILSGSKGCLLATPILIYLLHLKVLSRLPKSYRFLLVAMPLFFLSLIFHNSNYYLFSRFSEAIHGAQSWFQGRGVVEGSIAPRLELIRFGIDVGMANPWIGIGRSGMLHLLEQASAKGEYDVFITKLHTLHNEFLNIFVTKGILGLTSLLSVYFLGVRYFYALSRSKSGEISDIGFAGLGLFSMFLIFGLSEVALQLNSFRNFFLIFTVALMGIANKKNSQLVLRPK
jgi:O-antigen ligase